jgi:hypothetical protein
MDEDLSKLKPCPFCGAGETTIDAKHMSPRADRSSELISASVRHWCVKRPGTVQAFIEMRGRDEMSAITQWNSRAENES